MMSVIYKSFSFFASAAILFLFQNGAIASPNVQTIMLTDNTIDHLDIQTTKVVETNINSTIQKMIPYSALLYDFQGSTWVYITQKPLTYIREQVVVDDIEGNKVFLSEGPDVGTEVVSLGAAELYAIEMGKH